jgi:S-DNA-T family DNA segregation ATPase FtsK/SpoIIIE
MGNANIHKEKKRTLRQEIIGLIICFVALFLVAGILLEGNMGSIGNMIISFSFGIFGVTNYLVPIILVIFGANLIMKNIENGMRILRLGTLFIMFSSFLAFLICLDKLKPTGELKEFIVNLYTYGIQKTGGGILGGMAYPLISFFGIVGTYIIFICAIIITILLITRIHPATVIAFVVKKYKSLKAKKTLRNNIEKEVKEPKREIKEKVPFEKFDLSNQIEMDEKGKIKEADNDSENSPKQNSDNKEEAAKQDNMPIPVIKIESTDHHEFENYILPSIELLSKHKSGPGDKYKKELMSTANKLQATLDSFGVSAKVINVSRGPAVTRYELAPDVGVKVSRIVGLTDDIALNLAAPSIRMEAPIPGKSAVGIEIPNSSIDAVYLRDIIESNEFDNNESKIVFGLGKDTSGDIMIADIAKMPHVLIAGATGSGKSVCINTIITSILYRAKPNEVKLIMIDPKVVELGVYNGIPHLLIPVVTDPKKAAGALNWAVQEMVGRYNLFAAKGVRDIKGYNEALKAAGESEMLPHIVIIIDELSDLMMVAPNDVEDAICRLAQMARAAGMHLVIATQRPSVDVITGLIKANVPSRIAFAVSSQVDSRTILDMGGAEKLLGKGDMLFYPMGASKPIRVQGAFVTDKEVEKIVDFIKSNHEVKYDEDIIEKIQNSDIGSSKSEEDAGDNDPLLNDVISLVVDIGQASTSLIQRRFKVGYARAARIVDQMEARGIISGFDGTKPRQVLISKEDWEELQTKADCI